MVEDKITALCQVCGEKFEYILKPGFPRKYCPDCSASKKAEYEAKSKPVEIMTTPDYPKPITAKHDVVISRSEKPHSYEFGPANQRHKIYYEEVVELVQHIKNLEAADLIMKPFE